jgi:sulfonate transport system substrate-binding protein
MRKIAALLAVLAVMMAGCVSREENSGAKEAPTTVPLSELSGLTLNVGDQKGGTEALLRAAGALENRQFTAHLRGGVEREGEGRVRLRRRRQR